MMELAPTRVIQIRFYYHGSCVSGTALLAEAAVCGHREGLYSLLVIQFNSRGNNKDDHDLRAGATLCTRVASLGHVDALRELSHCLKDDFGVQRSVLDGLCLLIQDNARVLAAIVVAGAPSLHGRGSGKAAAATASRWHSCLLSDFGCRVAAATAVEAHTTNRFLVDWFASRALAQPVAGAGTVAAAQLVRG
jgi:hypothetical protein